MAASMFVSWQVYYELPLHTTSSLTCFSHCEPVNEVFRQLTVGGDQREDLHWCLLIVRAMLPMKPLESCPSAGTYRNMKRSGTEVEVSILDLNILFHYWIKLYSLLSRQVTREPDTAIQWCYLLAKKASQAWLSRIRSILTGETIIIYNFKRNSAFSAHDVEGSPLLLFGRSCQSTLKEKLCEISADRFVVQQSQKGREDLSFVFKNGDWSTYLWSPLYLKCVIGFACGHWFYQP